MDKNLNGSTKSIKPLEENIAKFSVIGLGNDFLGMTAKMQVTENSLAVQWLGLHGQSSIAGDMGLISGWETKIPQGLAKKKKRHR